MSDIEAEVRSVMNSHLDVADFLLAHGTDMTIRDYRWNGTAQGWAFHAANDEKMARWLEDAQRQREQ